MQCAPAAGSLGRWPGSRLLAQCLAPAAFSSWLAKPGPELAPWEHKVQRGQTTNTRVKQPNYNVSSHPLPSTVPASTLTAVTRHQVWPARCNGPPHEISPSPSSSGRHNKGGTVFCFVFGDVVHYTFSCSGPTCYL